MSGPTLSGDDLAIVKRLEGDCDQVTVGEMWFAAGVIRQLYDALGEMLATHPAGSWPPRCVRAYRALEEARGETA